MAETSKTQHAPITIKKYANRRLYNTATSSYVTLEHLCQKGQNLLPISFLRQLISLYGDSLADVVPRYLEMSMSSFYRNEEQMRDMMQKAVQGMFPLNQIEEMNKQNMAIFESAMKMFSPFNYKDGEGVPDPQSAPGMPANGAAKPAQAAKPSDRTADPVQRGQENIDELRARLNTVQHQLDELLGRGGKGPTTGGKKSG
jgi:polyhydroxyalkanoate synthesis regulator protein